MVSLQTLLRYHLIVVLALHCLSCTKRDISIKETTAQVLLGRVAIYTSAGAAEVLDTEIFTNDGKFKNNSKTLLPICTSQVLDTDIYTSNGIIHVVDHVV